MAPSSFLRCLPTLLLARSQHHIRVLSFLFPARPLCRRFSAVSGCDSSSPDDGVSSENPIARGLDFEGMRGLYNRFEDRDHIDSNDREAMLGKDILHSHSDMTSFSFIEDLNPQRSDWKIKVRIIRQWNDTYSHVVSSIHMILLDEKGSKIHASIFRKDLIQRHKTLVEGNCYILDKFNVGENYGLFKTTKHPYRITFNYASNVRPCNVDIPVFSFEFVPFDSIVEEQNCDEYLIDVIAAVFEYGFLEDYESESRVGKKLILNLQDECECSLRCALFGEVAVSTSKFIANCIEPITLILQLSRIRFYKGENILTTSWNATRVLLNPNIPAVTSFRHRPTPKLLGEIDSNSQALNGSTGSDPFFESSMRMSLKEVIQTKEGGKATIVGKVKDILETENWFYDSCNFCKSKVQLTDNSLYCSKCGRTPTTIIPRYKTHLLVSDKTEIAEFVLFDKEAVQIFKKPAYELHQALLQDDNQYGFPSILKTILGKEFCFVIKLNEAFNRNVKRRIFPVLKISDDEALIADFHS